MMDVLEDIDLLLDYDLNEIINIAMREYNIRPRTDHFNYWDNRTFFKRFRLSKPTVTILLEEINEEIRNPTERDPDRALTPMNKLLLTLRYSATGSFYLTVADFGGIHKSSAGRIINTVITAICRLRERYIRIPRYFLILKDLQNRLTNTLPFQEPLEGAKHHYGLNSNLLRKIVEFWKTEYKWRDQEKFLNKFPQFKVGVQGLNIHYIHVKPEKTEGLEVRPMLLLHGWPGSVREFYEIIPLLTKPQKGKKFVFEVIVPSLPGYGFSDAAVRPGLSNAHVAVIMENLMQKLGFKKFYAQGGDWGGIIVNRMSVLFPNKLLGVHSNLCWVISPLANLKMALYGLYPSAIVEKKHENLVYPRLEKLSNLLLESGYLHLQATKPDTVGVALRESPAGLAAYILEKFITWTNPEFKELDDGGLTKKYTMTKLLDNVMIYWVTRSITTSARLYAESFSPKNMGLRMDDIPVRDVPYACARFRRELTFFPESILRDHFLNLVHTSDYDGGHFAAFELPNVMAEDIYTFVEKVEKV